LTLPITATTVPEKVTSPQPDPAVWKLKEASICFDQPIVMGIVNVTPDSFSDDGTHTDVDAAVALGQQMAASGATIVDVGGESTRPGASLVSLDAEIGRVVPVIERLASGGALVSIDTSKPDVARAAIDAGAVVVNDITGLENHKMRTVCAESGVGVVLMHMQGTPRTMQRNPLYDDVVTEVRDYLLEGARAAINAGILRDSIVVDPGIGFGKDFDHNIELMRHLDVFCETGFPVLIGTSRKGFLGKILEPIRGATLPKERDGATAATIALAVAAGVRILRVHNVPLAVEVAHTANAMVQNDHGKETNRT
jgi:dihydropteroate synthase